MNTTAPIGARDDTEELSAESLAARAGVTVRTIRYYQSAGLLPLPTRRGRQAFYGPDHLERLELIAELSRRGLRLSAIGELLAHSFTPTSADEWLGLGDVLVQPWTQDRPVLMTEAELAEALAGSPGISPPGLEAIGLVERRSDTTPVVYLVPSPGMLEVALATEKLGLDLSVASGLLDLLQSRLRETATELVSRFTDEVSMSRLSTQGPGQLAELLAKVQPLARRTVDLLFAHEMERAQRQLLEAAGADLTAAPDTRGTR
ncbi:MAG: MerR family transcriptional regulator [Acidimicrobiales bacterium]